ncbi:phage portal protein [Phenylobacterium sp.]|uniref:phage portal protein n=1 Tax=Phenylobacterium sp. TaxID=1871053 RepID=UPI0035B098B1
MNLVQRGIAKLFRLNTRRFEAASGRRWTASGDVRFGSYGPETLGATDAVRRRARAAVANNAWIANGVAALVSNIIGAGITPTSQHPGAVARKLAQKAFARWAVSCDADGLTDFYGLQAAAVRAMIIDGESFVQLIATEAGLRLRLIPAELIDLGHTVELGGGARVVAGVEFDSAGVRTAYWVRPIDPTSVYESYGPPVRVPAADMLHLFRPLGPGQVRGISWLAPILIRSGELDQLEDALLVGAKVAAMHAGFLIDQNGTAASGTPYEGIGLGSILETGLEPGTLKVLPGGYDVRFSTPQQAQQTVEFAKLELRGIAAGLGVPEFLLTGDLSGANYGSQRGGLVEFRKRNEAIQFHTVIPQLLRPIWDRFVLFAVLSGGLDGSDFSATVEEHQACEWIPPAQEWIDPAKDAQATATMIGSGLMSRRQAVAARGYSVEDLDAEIAADREREEGLGLAFTPTGEREAANAPA